LKEETYKETLGTVVATSKSPSTQRIDFVLTKEEFVVSKGELVEIPFINIGIIIAVVQEIQKYNAYYSNIDATKDLNHISTSVENLDHLFPTNEWASTVVTLRPLGFISPKSSKINRIHYPVSPGSLIYRARSELIKKFLGFVDKDQGIHLGSISTDDTPVIIDITKLFQKHLAILAISGAGKSYATSILLEELISRDFNNGRLPVLIIDPHGEYKNFAELLDQPSLATVYSGKLLSIQTNSLKPWHLREFAPDMSVVQLRELEKIILELKKNNENYSFKDIIEKIIDSDIVQRTKDSLLGWLDGLEKSRIFGTNSYPDLPKIIRPGKISIFDLSDFQSLKQKQIICAYIARTAFEFRRESKISPFLLIIEEAHQFCPENGLAISKHIIETIAREGRKFFASLCLISQRPVNLSSTVLSQCNTHLIMRIRNPYDLDYIGKLSEGIDRDTQRFIPDLAVGEGILVGEAVNYPVLFKVRKRKLEIKNKSESLIKELEKFDYQ
jgi:hypothetical protein